MSPHLLMFYGTECPHCERMHSLVSELEKETGIQVEKLEVWHNEENKNRLLEIDKGLCGGVPFFYNTKTKKSICGEASLEELKTWTL